MARFHIGKRGGSDGGMSFQLPKGWDDGSGKIRHVKDGIHKGRVVWTSRHEAKEIAKRLQDREERHVRYDPQ
jgi:hypothetical protein